MGEFGDLLERLHGARHRWRTVQAGVHHWTDAALTQQAWDRHTAQAERDGSGVVVRSRGDPPAAGLTADPVERVWIDAPGKRHRTERDDRLRVRVGETWWHYNAGWGATSNEAEPKVGGGGHDIEDGLEWEAAEQDGVTMQVYDSGRSIEVKREMSGVHVRLSGDFDRTTTLEIAASLQPAPMEPPRLVEPTRAP